MRLIACCYVWLLGVALQVLLSCIKEEYDALRKAAAVGTLSRQCGHGSGSEPGTPGSDKIKAA